MLTRLNHVAIAVPDLKAAVALYCTIFEVEISESVDLPDHGITTVFITLANTKIELITPLGDDSPIDKFLQSHPQGGIHHLCFEVDTVADTHQALIHEGIRVLEKDKLKLGARNKQVVFLHPKDTLGCLLELEER